MTCSDIALVTDAWYPQTNGVVRTLDTVRKKLEETGRQVTVISPEQFFTLPCPTYPEIRLSLGARRRLSIMLNRMAPRHIHIATEGPLGLAARHYCVKRGLRFTTSFHTKFPEYLQQRTGIPPRLAYRWLRHFHAPAEAVLVPTRSMLDDLITHGFRNGKLWTRGVDTAQFYPGDAPPLDGPAPHWLYVGRVSVEKNLPAFLALDLHGSKHVVGDGPALAKLQQQFPAVHFAGAKKGEALRQYYAASDVFVFPSRTDTFGLVMLEALACGTPIAAYPVTGPKDVITDPRVGRLDDDLAAACHAALACKREDCIDFARLHSWERCADIFAQTLCPSGAPQRSAA